mmetsp:Transcript_26574/g.48057  ORF Transcript_26574/g.48057 Transcript_26574/m.48057 type:complete len:159 (+) Transcript_26574:2331-2807(+)
MFGGTCDGKDGPWTRVPPPQTILPSDGERTLKTKGRKAFLRNEFLRRVGIAPNSKRALQKDLRICGRHQFVNLRDTYKYETLELDESGNHKAKSTTDDFWVPASKGEKAVTTTSSKGLGVDRFQAKLLSEIATESWTAATQQCSQLSDESAPELSQVN